MKNNRNCLIALELGHDVPAAELCGITGKRRPSCGGFMDAIME